MTHDCARHVLSVTDLDGLPRRELLLQPLQHGRHFGALLRAGTHRQVVAITGIDPPAHRGDQRASGQQVADEADLPHRHALPGHRGLNDLIGVVEPQPALRLGLRQAQPRIPAAPRQRLHVGAGDGRRAVDAHIVDPHAAGQIVQSAGRAPGLRQRGAAHRSDFFAEQKRGVRRACQGVVVAQAANGDVQPASFQVAEVVEGFDGDVDVGMGALKFSQPGNQPLTGERGKGGDLHPRPPLAGAQPLHRGVELLQRLPNHHRELLASG